MRVEEFEVRSYGDIELQRVYIDVIHRPTQLMVRKAIDARLVVDSIDYVIRDLAHLIVDAVNKHK